VRVYGLLLRRLLPARLIEPYGRDMEETFEDLWAAAAGRGLLVRWGVFVREVFWLVRTAWAERSRRALRQRIGKAGIVISGNDVQRVVRALRRSPSWSLMMVAILALGMGAVALVFSLVNGVVIRPLPYEDAGRLVMVWMVREDGSQTTVSPAAFQVMRRDARSLSGLGAHNLWFPTLVGESNAERVIAAQLTPGLFEVLGARAMHGRLFRSDEGTAGRDRVVVLSHGLWRRRYAGDVGVIGRTVRLSGLEYEVIGVLPPTYHHPDVHFPMDETQLFTPFVMDEWSTNHTRFLRVVARLSPGATVEGARSEVARLVSRYAEQYPEMSSGRGGTLSPLRDQLFGGVRQTLWLALGAAFLLFTIVCANASNLLLVRMLSRRREFAIRTALGASGFAVARQLVTEAAILALLGGAAGLALQAGVLRGIRGWLAQFMPPAANFDIDVRVALFVLIVTVVAALLLSFLALAETQRTGPRAVLSAESAGSGGSVDVLRMRRLLVGGEIALTVALVIGTGLLATSFARLSRIDPGFDARPVLIAEIAPDAATYSNDDAVRALYGRVAERISSLPGATEAGFVSDMSLVSSENRSRRYDSPDRPMPAELRRDVEFQTVSPGYFSALRIPLLAGRSFTDRDRADTQPVVMVNAAAAAFFWPGEPAEGKRLRWALRSDTIEARVVGVVGNVLDDQLTGEPDAFVYHAFAQQPSRVMHLVLRAAVDPARLAQPVRAALREIDARIAVTNVDALEERVLMTVGVPRAATNLGVIVAVLALVLSGLGVYGIAAYDVNSRVREFGIRVALGAERIDVLRLIVGRALVLTAGGIVVGLIVGLAAARLLRTFLFAMSYADAASFVVAPIVLALVSLAAAIVPARRALAVQPADALRIDRR
jgi:putative ABC transport system permease protein